MPSTCPHPLSRSPLRREAAGAGLLPAGAGPAVRVLDTCATFKVGPADRGGFSLVELHTASGGGMPWQAQPHEDRALYVVAGRYAVRVGDHAALLDAGGCAFVPRGTAHTYTNVADEPGRLLVVASPATTEERVFAELAAAFAAGAGAPTLLHVVARVAGMRGITLAPPPAG